MAAYVTEDGLDGTGLRDLVEDDLTTAVVQWESRSDGGMVIRHLSIRSVEHLTGPALEVEHKGKRFNVTFEEVDQ